MDRTVGWGVMGGILSWWDGVELWLTGRGFVLQAVVVMPAVLALAYGLAVILDGLLGRGVELRRRVVHRPGRGEDVQS